MEWSPRVDSPGVRKAANLFNFVENNLTIRVKQAQTVSSGKGKRRRKTRLVPFRFNTVQRILCQLLAYHWHHEIPVRWWIPKSRQMGISTWAQAILFSLALGTEGYHVATVAHVDYGATEIFAKSETFEKNLEVGYQRPMSSRQQGKFLWEHESSIWVGSIKAGDALGRGPTLNAIHFSEVANFADHGQNPEQATSAALGSLADGPDSIVLYESTAKGRDPFYYAGCEKAKDPRSGTYDQLVFLPWYLEDGYRMTWQVYRERRIKTGKDDPGKTFEPTDEEQALRRRIANLPMGKGEELWQHPQELSDEQLIWYRDVLDTKCHGKPETRAREYPSTYDEAFTSTAQCMFDAATIQHYQRLARPSLSRVNLVKREEGEPVELLPNVSGRVQIWVPPHEGGSYVIGADIGGKRAKSDPSAAYVIEESTLEVVAAYHGKVDWEVYASDLQLLGEYYNWALLVPENNHNPAVAGALHKARYPNLYYYFNDEIAARQTAKVPGFNTNRKTRPLLLSHLDKVFRDRSLRCYDAKVPIEMEWFVWVAPLKKYAATGKHTDDRLMALALAVLQAKNYRPPADEAAEAPISGAVRRFLELQELGKRNAVPSGPVIL